MFIDVDVTFASTESSLKYSQLRERTKYFWRVLGVRKSDGEVITGPMSSFTTAYETLSADDNSIDFTVGQRVHVESDDGGVFIRSSIGQATHVVVVNILGQIIAEGTLDPNSSLHIPYLGLGPLFISVASNNRTVFSSSVLINR